MKSRFSSFAAAVVLLGLGTSYTGVQIASARERIEPLMEVFIGQIAKNPDSNNRAEKYILRDEEGTTTYFIEDKGKAAKCAKYDGDRVQVMASRESANTTAIHVKSILEVR
jgi:hypothetical protein